MTIVLDVSFNEQSNSDSQNSAINEINRKKVKDKRHESSSKASKAAKVKNKVSFFDINKIIITPKYNCYNLR